MKIYCVSWYNEDDYGPMEMIYLVVQANDKDEALRIAVEEATREDGWALTEERLKLYEKLDIDDITEKKIIVSGTSSFGFGV
jgi:adenosyl cobinamide kinase/adenosyl cobinamide phosphate guanylyltransferase